MRYTILYTDGAKMDSLTLDGAMQIIAWHCRVKRRDLITETTGEKISVWLYPSDRSIAEIIVSSATVLPSSGVEWRKW
jgi:hypothetical protein